MIKISLLADDATSKPVGNFDYVIMSNSDDGGITWNVSKKILVSELLTFIQSAIPSISGSGTTNTMALFTASGVVGDSYMTQTADGTALLTKHLGVGVAADADTQIYIVSGAADEFPLYIFQEYTGGSDTAAIFATSQGANAGINTGIKGRARFSTELNVGVHGLVAAAGISHDPVADDSIDNIAGRFQTASAGTQVSTALYATVNGAGTVTSYAAFLKAGNLSSGDTVGLYVDCSSTGGASNALQLIDGSEGTAGDVWTSTGTTGKGNWATPSGDLVIGGVTLSSSSNTNILNGTYVILADTTTVTSVTSGIGQDSNWTLEVTQAGITNQKGVVTFTGNLEKDGGGGANYDVAIFKNGSIVSESEQIDHKLESGGKGQSVTVMAITEFSTNDTFDIRVSGNGTADDIFCGGGSLYIQ